MKKKLDQHRQRCRDAYFTCIDCSTTFNGTDYRQHTQCITEDEKYQKALYRPKGKKANGNENGKTNGCNEKPKEAATKTTTVVDGQAESKKRDTNEATIVTKKSPEAKHSKKEKPTTSDDENNNEESSTLALYKLVKQIAKEQGISTKKVLKRATVVTKVDKKSSKLKTKKSSSVYTVEF